MERPKLRKVERIALQRDGEDLLVLRDPLDLSPPVALDAAFAPLLDALDGERTLPQLRQSLMMRGLVEVDAESLEAFVRDLDAAGLLEGDRFVEMWRRQHDAFMESPVREPRMAGVAYPEDEPALREALEAQVPGPSGRTRAGSQVIGVVCPHTPPEMAGPTVAETLVDLPAPDEVDAVIVLGTDHGPGLLPFAVTDKPYRTPLGDTKPPTFITRHLHSRLPWLRREEIRHRQGASIEMACLWLQHIYGEDCPPVLPLLCGQTVITDPGEELDNFLGHFEGFVEDYRLLIWASAELSHAGPAYGHRALDATGRKSVEARDESCTDALRGGLPDAFVRRCMAEHPHGRPSGAAALSVLVRMLPVGYRAKVVRYALEPAPGDTPGSMGLLGMRFSAAT